MGTNTIIDILGSMIIGGMLMIILWRMNDAAAENMYNYGGELILQQNLAVTSRVLEYDFRKIGYCETWNKMVDASNAILIADSNEIKFLTDIYPDGNPDGNIDTLYYRLGPVTELTETANPRDRFLYRIINGETPKKINLGVTQFRLMYFDALDDTIPFPINYPVDTKTINSMEISITVEDVAAYDKKYSSAIWRQIRLVSRNLKER
jgi:type II secretory pathway component PulJ